MRSIITGATGCLGFNLTKRLLKEGHEVIALGRNTQIGDQISQMGAQWQPIALEEKDALKKIACKADFIFHCAALSSPWGAYAEFYKTNVLGTENIIHATPTSARLIHVSSPSIYFDFTEKHQIKEHATLPLKAANHYIKTKRLAESLIDKAQSEQRIQSITIRPRAIFGPYDRSILPRLLDAERQGLLPVIGSGKNIIDITYVDNVCEALILAANAKTHFLGKKYNITNDQPLPLNILLSLLYQSLKKPLKIKYISYPLAKTLAFGLEKIHQLGIFKGEPAFTRYTTGVLALGQTLNIDAAKTELGYQPVLSIEQGMEQFANWYLAND